MFGIGFQEMLIILVVVLIFFGPKRLPDLAKSMGKGIAEFKKASEDIRKGIDEAMKEDAAKEDAAPAAEAPSENASIPAPPPDAATPIDPAKGSAETKDSTQPPLQG